LLHSKQFGSEQFTQVLSPGLYIPGALQSTSETHYPLNRASVVGRQPQEPLEGVFRLKVATQPVHSPVESAHVVQFAAQSKQVLESVLN